MSTIIEPRSADTDRATTIASPVDFETYGDYRPGPDAFRGEGANRQLDYPFEGRIPDVLPEEAGRYHLYVSLYCPWAQRPLIALKLRGLEDVVTWSSVDPVRDGRGWAFREGDGYEPDPINGFELLREAYDQTRPGFAGHVSVPTLWDRATDRIASNHYPTLTLDLETAFGDWADPDVELVPDALRPRILVVNDMIRQDLMGPSHAARFAKTQADLDAATDKVFATLAALDERLAGSRYLVADTITDADLLLYVTLVRFDVVTAPLGRLLRHRLDDYPHLWAYARDLHRIPAFGDTTDFTHIMEGTWRTQVAANPSRLVPDRPALDWESQD